MSEFESKNSFFASSLRAAFLIMPLIAEGEVELQTLAVSGAEDIGFDSESMSDLIRHKCARQQGFVRRFRLPDIGLEARFAGEPALRAEDTQLIAFENGAGFLAVLFRAPDEEIGNIYSFVNPGYLRDKDERIQQRFIDDVRSKVLAGTGFEPYVESEDKKLAVKESYLLNAAFTDCRYDELATLERAAFNAHKLIRLGEDFEDASEKDIAYTYGARDTENRTYRWGCCVSSQSISFVYGPGNADYDPARGTSRAPAGQMSVGDILAATEDDLLLTVLALYQKSTCALLNQTIYKRMREQKGSRKEIQRIKSAALRFRAYDTITPSQVSRWNNVCETYRYLLELNGVPEALADISDNIEMLNEEKERIDAERRGFFGTMIAVFGLVSIVAATLQIVDYQRQGDPVMRLWAGISLFGVVVFVIAWAAAFLRKKR